MATLDNARHERFIQNIVKGMTQRQAYKDAFPDNNSNDKTVDEAASRLFNDSKVHTRYEELLEELEDKSIMSAKDRMKWLTNLINGEEGYISDKLKSIDILNKMSGQYITKIEAEVDNTVNINIQIDDEE